MIETLLSHIQSVVKVSIPDLTEVFLLSSAPDASFPYSVIQFNQMPDDTKTSYGYRTAIEIHLWYQSYNHSSIFSDIDALWAALHDTTFLAPDSLTHHIELTSKHLFDDPNEDFLIVHGVLRLMVNTG